MEVVIKKGKIFIRTLCIVFLIVISVESAEKKWAVYFTTPGIKKSKEMRPNEALIKFIDSTKENLYGAFFEIDSYSISNAFIRAQKRGVDVKIVTDSDYINNGPLKKMIKNGIQVIQDNRSAFMHNKFAIADSQYVWTGSFNITDNGSFRNNNNAIWFNSSDLYKIYLAEFKEMYDYKIFGNKKEEIVFPFLKSKYYVKIDDMQINVYFSPDDNVRKNILNRIRKSKKSIYFMAFSFTDDEIGEEMIKARKRGVEVKGVFEARGAGSQYSEYTKMKLENIDVRKDKNKYNMHHKTIIIDEEWVITGSYNFSVNASKSNDENIIMIKNPDIAGKYLAEFKRVYGK